MVKAETVGARSRVHIQCHLVLFSPREVAQLCSTFGLLFAAQPRVATSRVSTEPASRFLFIPLSIRSVGAGCWPLLNAKATGRCMDLVLSFHRSSTVLS